MEPEADFQKYIWNIYANGCLMLSMSLGHELGLFKLLCDAEEPMSLKEIAEKLGLKERYTLEWLSSMVSANIICQDRDTRLYYVPETHKSALNSTTALAPLIDTCGKRSDPLKKCFRKDGPWGISYQECPEWFVWFNGYRSQVCDDQINKEILPLWYKQPGLKEKLEHGIQILDVGCGPGNYTNVLAQKFPNSTFTGLDYSEKGIELAKSIKAEKGLTNVHFVKGDAQNMPEEWTKHFDMIFVYDTLHDLPDPHKCLEEIYRVMKDDGCMSLMEVGFHSDPLDNVGNITAAMYYTVSIYICLSSSLTEEPHIGYGAVWGIEEVEKALKEKKFQVSGTGSISIIETKAFFFCTK